mmetsp:Transcript_11573/g.31013  ORF Transcript_11573/g.31013 Transcript_11573/m.31013 type:complete len:960 (-) Transcript_11573:1352-4231(-)
MSNPPLLVFSPPKPRRDEREGSARKSRIPRPASTAISPPEPCTESEGRTSIINTPKTKPTTATGETSARRSLIFHAPARASSIKQPANSAKISFRAKKLEDDQLRSALQARLYVVRRTGPNAFLVRGDTAFPKYQVCIGDQTCTCSGKAPCLHLLFVLLRVVRLEQGDPRLLAKRLHDFEVEEVMRDYHSRMAAKAKPAERRMGGKRGDEVIRKSLDTESQCPICLMQMCEGESLSWCHFGCGNNVHTACLKIWAEEREAAREPVSCPMCRHEWEKKKVRPKAADGDDTKGTPERSKPSDKPPVLPHAEEISPMLLPLAKGLISSLGEEVVQRALSRNHKAREIVFMYLRHFFRRETQDEQKQVLPFMNALGKPSAVDAMAYLFLAGLRDSVLQVYRSASMCADTWLRQMKAKGCLGIALAALTRVGRMGEKRLDTVEIAESRDALSLKPASGVDKASRKKDHVLSQLGHGPTSGGLRAGSSMGGSSGEEGDWHCIGALIDRMGDKNKTVVEISTSFFRTILKCFGGELWSSYFIVFSHSHGGSVVHSGVAERQVWDERGSPVDFIWKSMHPSQVRVMLGYVRSLLFLLQDDMDPPKSEEKSTLFFSSLLQLCLRLMEVGRDFQREEALALLTLAYRASGPTGPLAMSFQRLFDLSLSVKRAVENRFSEIDSTIIQHRREWEERGRRKVSAENAKHKPAEALFSSKKSGPHALSSSGIGHGSRGEGKKLAAVEDVKGSVDEAVSVMRAAAIVEKCAEESSIACNGPMIKESEGLRSESREESPFEGMKFKWRRGDVIGRGGNGCVFEVFDEKGWKFAMKEIAIPNSTAVSSSAMKDIQQEMELLGSLDHPNVVQFIGSERSSEYFRIFMECVEGGSIGGLIGREGQLGEEVASGYARQLVAGVSYLHKQGVIHRDLKGGNLLVTEEGVLKVADFGASAQLGGVLTMSGEFKSLKGTPFW